MKNLSLRPLLFAVLLALPFALHFSRVAFQNIEEIDESAWIFSSYYYRLAFMQGSYLHQDWHDRDALDHPPLAKYTIGFALSLVGLVPESLAERTWWHTHDLDLLDREGFMQRQWERTPPQALFVGRSVSTLFFIACAFLIYLVSAGTLSPVPALFAGILFSLHPLVQRVSGQVMADGIFLFFLLGSILTQQALARRVAAGQAVLPLSVSAGACMGLLFLTKIIGLAELPIAFAGLLLTRRRGPGNTGSSKLLIRSGLAVFLSWAFVSYVLNPSWWSDPLAFLAKMFRFRLDRVGLQMGVFVSNALPSPLLSLSVALHKIFFEWDGCYVSFKVPVLLLLTSFGCVQSLRSLRKATPMERVLLLNAGVWSLITVDVFKLEWDRYLLPMVPFVVICAVRGFRDAYQLFAAPIVRPSLAAVGLSLTLALLLGVFSATYTRSLYESRHAGWFRAARASGVRKQLEFHPDNPDLWLELANLDESLGNRTGATQDWREYLRSRDLEKREQETPAN